MNVTLGSAFRNSSGVQIARYTYQALGLRRYLADRGDELFVVAGEGDSTDSTVLELDKMLNILPGKRVDVSHGGPVYGSTEAAERMAALQGVGNGILGAVPTNTDFYIYVESDLIWTPEALGGLLQTVKQVKRVDLVAPLVFAGTAFYDIWAFRKDGQRFGPFYPFHPQLNGQLLEVDSVGSCLAMKAEVAHSCRLPPEDALVGFCRDAKSKGYRVWVDPTLKVLHP